jgi:hypothetical protein
MQAFAKDVQSCAATLSLDGFSSARADYASDILAKGRVRRKNHGNSMLFRVYGIFIILPAARTSLPGRPIEIKRIPP